MMSLVGPDGAMELYDGVLRVREADGRIALDGFEDQRYRELIEEEVKPWTYMKFPYLRALGPRPAGTASARWRGCRTATSSRRRAPKRERQAFVAAARRRPVHAGAGLPLGAHDRDAARVEVIASCSTTRSSAAN
jgi:NAD-reducing hydrogenase large subunit